MAQILRFTRLGISDSAQGGSDHVAVFESAGQLRALVRVMAQPMQQLRKSPLVGVDAATPFNRFQMFAMRQVGNLLRFTLGPVIAPQVVVVERPQMVIDHHHA